MTPRYEIRAVTRSDRDDLLELASHLDSVNLPNDPSAMEPIIERSYRSFSGEIEEINKRVYVFVLYDLEEKRAVGTSMIFAQLGRRDAPYIYFDVKQEERYSSTLDSHLVHDVLSIGYSYDGPTEIGGLVMHPEYRGVKGRLGTQISYVRFLWIAMHRALFRDEVLAELLPPLEEDGTSRLWEAVGRRFTNMTYQEADKLSRENKEFIRGLFPDGYIYASLLSDEAQDVIGKVGRDTRGVEKLLRRIGFRYANRVDPFDGGPHFLAKIDDVSLVQQTLKVTAVPGSPGHQAKALVARTYSKPPFFCCIATPYRLTDGVVVIPEAVLLQLEIEAGEEVTLLPLP